MGKRIKKQEKDRKSVQTVDSGGLYNGRILEKAVKNCRCAADNGGEENGRIRYGEETVCMGMAGCVLLCRNR